MYKRLPIIFIFSVLLFSCSNQELKNPYTPKAGDCTTSYVNYKDEFKTLDKDKNNLLDKDELRLKDSIDAYLINQFRISDSDKSNTLNLDEAKVYLGESVPKVNCNQGNTTSQELQRKGTTPDEADKIKDKNLSELGKKVAEPVILNLEKFYETNKYYPEKLTDLVPDYAEKVETKIKDEGVEKITLEYKILSKDEFSLYYAYSAFDIVKWEYNSKLKAWKEMRVF